MTDKSDELVNELLAAAIAFGREREPNWQTRIDAALSALKAHIEELEMMSEGLEEDFGSYDSLIPEEQL